VSGRKTVDELLAEARSGLERVTPEQALEAMRDGGVLVDVRSEDEQVRQGFVVPGALHLPLSVVLWRLDPEEPAGGAPVALDARVMLICRQGYSSSLAAAQLRELGFANATDVIGGTEAWDAAGLPVEPTG
jgi:rhodanese-related sulfurtransferase